MKIDPQIVKALRTATGAGMMAAKSALESAEGDMDKAMAILRKAGHEQASARAGKEARAGLVEAYVHLGRVGALVEVNCETDFVARTDDFKNFAHELAMQVAAAAPLYLAIEDVPPAEIAKEKAIDQNLDGFYKRTVLIKQPAIHDPESSVEEKLKDLIAKVGENVVIKRFERYELGQS